MQTQNMQHKRVLAIHDLCAYGRCSLTAVVPILSAMGVQACPFPTAVFSNNFTYGSFVFSDFTERMPGFLEQWEKLGLTFDAVYSGFLSTVEQMEIVRRAARRYGRKSGAASSLVVIDPAMGDEGKLYPTFTEEMVLQMRRLVEEADLMTPNFTEARLLLGEDPMAPAPSAGELQAMCRSLSRLGARQVVITSVPTQEGRIKVASFDAGRDAYAERETVRIPFFACGTGDAFTSVVTGAMLRGQTLESAVALAMTFVSYAIEQTVKAGTDARAGILLEPCLSRLLAAGSNA